MVARTRETTADTTKKARKSGINVLGDIPWGTHLCQFYQTKEDLMDILVPYFQAGLDNDEFCLWITADSLGEREAEKAMGDAMPDFYSLYHAKWQIDIADRRWYFKDGSFNLPAVLSGQGGRTSQALARGYDGIRVAVDVSWLDKKRWKGLASYEEEVKNSIGGQPAIFLCSYSLAKYGATEVLDVVRNHEFALVKREGEWQLLGTSEREAAEIALSGSDQGYKALLESTPEGMLIIDAETMRVVMANQAAAEVFGLASVEDAVGINPLEFIPLEERDRVITTIAEDMFEKDLRQVNEFRALTRDGREIWISAWGMRTEYLGRLVGVTSIRDITAQKLAEEKLQASEEEKRLLLDNATVAIVVVQDGMLKFANSKAAELSGYSHEELTSRPFTEFIHPDDRQTLTELYLKLMAGSEIPRGLAFRVISKGGSTLWAGFTAVLFTWERKPALWCFLNDITAGKQAEEALRDSEERLKIQFEFAPDAYYLNTFEGTFVDGNRAAEKMMGYTKEELIGKSFLTLNVLSEDQVPKAATLLAQNALGRPTGPDDLVLNRKDGTKVTVEVNTFPVKIKGQDLVLGIARDITKRKLTEEALEYRIEFERLMTMISSHLINLQSNEIDAGIQEALKSLGEFTGVDRSYVFLLSDDKTRMSTTHEWCVEGIKPQRQDLQDIPVEHFVWGMDKFTSSEPICLCRGADHPPEARNEIELFESLDIQTLLLIPMILHGSPVGFVGFDSVNTDKTWSEGEASLLRIAGETFLSAIERKQMEEELRDSERRYRLLAENISDAIWVTDMNLRPTYMSPSYTRLMGYSFEEAMARGIEESLTPASIEAAADTFAKVLAAEQKGERDIALSLPPLELEMIRKDGSTIWVASTVSFIRDADGRPIEMIGVLRDITDRKKADLALQGSEERFRGLVETTSDFVWERDEKGIYTYASPRIHEILGYEPQEALGKTPFDLMLPDEGSRARKIFESAVALAKSFSFVEATYLHKNGHPVIVETSGVPFFDWNGKLCGYRGISRDITERHEARKRLEQTLQKLQRTMEGTIQAITATVEQRDVFTAGHQQHVARLACAIAEELGFSSEQIHVVRIAGLLHDIGKISVPTEILSKPGHLSEIEMALIKTHSRVGYDILKTVDFPWPIADIVIQHHERLNGSGYPSGLREDDILIEARILGVADVVEAMTSHRPYRPAPGIDKALEEISRNSGRLYDANVVFACLRVFNEKGFTFEE